MSTTTLNTIKEAIEKKIAGLTTTGIALNARKFVRASDYNDWRERPLSDVDRRFTVQMDPGGGWTSFGTLTEHTASSRMVVVIGHIIGQQMEETQKRRDTDARKIVLEMMDPANRPTSVWRIALEPPISSVAVDGKWWETTMRFQVTFSEANP
jgi:hypothetical protein